MASVLPEGRQSFTDSAGAPLVGGKLWTYNAGTSTPRPTYTDASGTVANTNPVILDARGEAAVYWDGAYKVVLTDAAGVTIWTADNISSGDAAQVSSVFDTMTDSERADVIAGTLLIDVGPKIQAAIDAVYAAGGGVLWFPVGKYKCGQRLYMRRGVTLMGPQHRIPTGSMYPTGVEGTIYGIARIVATSGVVGGFLFWNFKDPDKLRRPYGAQVHNIMLDCANQSSGAGVYITCLPAGEGVFSNGWAGAATEIDGMIILGGPSHGVFVESTDNEKINCQILRVRVGFCAGNGIYCYKCLDVKIDYCFVFDVRGNGLVMEGCATERVTDSDIFNCDGHGVVMDGFDARYRDMAVENNGKHGYYIRANVTGITDKRYRITGGRVGTNSYDYDNTYDNIHIEDRAGTQCVQISISQVVFGPQAHVGTTNRVRHQIHSTALPAQSGSSAIGCFFVGADRYSGNPYIDDNSLQSFNFSACLDGAGQEIVQKWYPLTAGAGLFWQPNVLRGVTRFKTQNTSAAVLWDIFGENASFIGKEIYILIDDLNTGVDFSGTNLRGNGGVDLVAGASTKGKIIRAVCIDGTIWACQVMG